METKNLQWSLWFVIFISAAVYYNIIGLGNLGVFAVTACYSIFGALALVILKTTKSDEKLYVNINLWGLTVSVLVSVGMLAIAVVCGLTLGLNFLNSGSSLVPTSFVQTASISGHSLAIGLGIVQVPSSYATCLLSDVLFDFLIISFVETVLVLAAISGLRDAIGPYAEREKKRKKMVLYGLLTGFCFIEPIAMWVAWHGLEAYAQWGLLIPAFINGIVLVSLMFVKSVGKIKFGIIAVIIAHGAYDSYITVSAYFTGAVTTANGLPLFPSSWSFADLYITFLLVPMAVVCLVIPIFLGRNE